MELKEILKAQGLTDEQIEAVLGSMSENKIYLSKEERIDERYEKLKGQHTAASSELEAANALIAELKESNAGNEELQAKVAEHEAKNADLQAENQKIKEESAIKFALLEAGVKDVDYCVYKLKEKNADLKIDDQGNLKGSEELIKGLKQQLPDQFPAKEEKKIDVHKLSGGEGDSSVTKDEFDKMGYQSRVALREENPDLYNELIKE